MEKNKNPLHKKKFVHSIKIKINYYFKHLFKYLFLNTLCCLQILEESKLIKKKMHDVISKYMILFEICDIPFYITLIFILIEELKQKTSYFNDFNEIDKMIKDDSFDPDYDIIYFNRKNYLEIKKNKKSIKNMVKYNFINIIIINFIDKSSN